MNKQHSAFKKEKTPDGKRRYNIGYIIRNLYDLGLDETKINNLLESYKNIPTVTISIKNKYGSSIISDNRNGIEEAVEHLINVHGRKKIGFIRGSENNLPCDERYEGYKTALKKFNIPLNEKLISDYCQFGIDFGEKAA